MNTEYPFFKVCRSDDNNYTNCFNHIIGQARGKNHITIGRLSDNDLVLPEPCTKVSRYHCAIERGMDRRWWLVDKDSTNGTFLRQGKGTTDIDVRCSNGTLPLRDGDIIRILGALAQNKPLYWQLTFCEPIQTEEAEGFQLAVDMEYRLSQQKLFRVTRWNREEIKLTEKEHALINYMALQNQANNNQPKVCKYKELIGAVWEEKKNDKLSEEDKQQINHLVCQLRKKIKLNSEEPRFLKSMRGQGYLLENITICE